MTSPSLRKRAPRTFRFDRALNIEEGPHKRRLTLLGNQVVLWGPRKSDPRNCDRCLCLWSPRSEHGQSALSLFGILAALPLAELCDLASHPLECETLE